MGTMINESKPRMGIFSHPFRLPRQRRGTGDDYNIYCGSGAFTVNQGTFYPADAADALCSVALSNRGFISIYTVNTLPRRRWKQGISCFAPARFRHEMFILRIQRLWFPGEDEP